MKAKNLLTIAALVGALFSTPALAQNRTRQPVSPTVGVPMQRGPVIRPPVGLTIPQTVMRTPAMPRTPVAGRVMPMGAPIRGMAMPRGYAMPRAIAPAVRAYRPTPGYLAPYRAGRFSYPVGTVRGHCVVSVPFASRRFLRGPALFGPRVLFFSDGLYYSAFYTPANVGYVSNEQGYQNPDMAAQQENDELRRKNQDLTNQVNQLTLDAAPKMAAPAPAAPAEQPRAKKNYLMRYGRDMPVHSGQYSGVAVEIYNYFFNEVKEISYGGYDYSFLPYEENNHRAVAIRRVRSGSVVDGQSAKLTVNDIPNCITGGRLVDTLLQKVYASNIMPKPLFDQAKNALMENLTFASYAAQGCRAK